MLGEDVQSGVSPSETWVLVFSIWRILMKNRIFAASYKRGIELMAAGCPLDYLYL
jgi:hypothetical protein